jgi:hypothetical protein
VQINAAMDCNSQILVYGIFCDNENCKQLYIGKTERKLKDRLEEHKGSVKKTMQKM